MRWIGGLALAAAMTCMSFAQKQKKDDEAFVQDKPTIGDAFPDLTVRHPNGEEFKLASLRGHHAVFVFGCLT